MSNFQDSISAEELKTLYTKAIQRKAMSEKAPWKGTEESVGNSELGIVQQAIDAVDDNCDFPIGEFLKGAHYSMYLYLRNLEAGLENAVEEDDTDGIVYLSGRLGQIKNIYDSLGAALIIDDEDEDEDA